MAAPDFTNWHTVPRDALMSIGIYSLDSVLANLARQGAGQAQLDMVRRSWLAFKAAQVRCALEREPVEGVVAMSGRRLCRS